MTRDILMGRPTFRIRLFFFIVCMGLTTFFQPRGEAKEKWHQINEEDGIKVYSRDVQGSSLVAFKGETEFEEPMEKIMWVLKDGKRRGEWIELYLKGSTLENRGPFEEVIYQAVDSPWPVSDRDMIFLSKAYRLKDGNVQIEMKSIDLSLIHI